MARREMEAVGQLLSLLAVDFDEPMRDMIFVEKIVELMARAIIGR